MKKYIKPVLFSCIVISSAIANPYSKASPGYSDNGRATICPKCDQGSELIEALKVMSPEQASGKTALYRHGNYTFYFMGDAPAPDMFKFVSFNPLSTSQDRSMFNGKGDMVSFYCHYETRRPEQTDSVLFKLRVEKN